MKVIKDNYKKFPIVVTCAGCGSVIEIENTYELEWQGDDIYFWNCPCCEFTNKIIATL